MRPFRVVRHEAKTSNYIIRLWGLPLARRERVKVKVNLLLPRVLAEQVGHEMPRFVEARGNPRGFEGEDRRRRYVI